MASDITLAAGDGSRRITYVEPADPTRDPAIRALEHAVAGLCEQLTKAEQRAALAERDAVALRGELGGLRISERVAVAEVAVLHQQLEVTERQAGVLRTELAELRKTEQTALDWAKTSAAEASDCARRRTTPRRPSGSPATRPPGCAPNWTPAGSGASAAGCAGHWGASDDGAPAAMGRHSSLGVCRPR